MIPIQRLNHAVLYVSDLKRAVDFYTRVFGFNVIATHGPMAFLRAKGSDNHHDLGLLGLGNRAKRAAPGTTGLYHLAWQVGNIHELAAAREVLLKEGALSGESDHGATKSLYGADPDGNEFEIMTLLPREEWGPFESEAPVLPLDWSREIGRAPKP
jgi:catechol-2,3-dioxygenase